jgi:hypothetical protein
VSKDAGTATVTFSSSVPLAALQTAISDKYKISSLDLPRGAAPQEVIAPSWFETYRPILLIFGYITLVTLLIQALNGSLHGGLLPRVLLLQVAQSKRLCRQLCDV